MVNRINISGDNIISGDGRNNGGDGELKIFTHKFWFTLMEPPKKDSYLFVCKGAPPLMLYQNKLFEERSLLVDSDERLGLVVGRLENDLITGEIRIWNDARVQFYEKKGVMSKGSKRYIELCTVIKPDNYAGSTKVILDGETIIMYAVDKANGVM